MGKLIALYGSDGSNPVYGKFWAKIIPRSVIEETLRYCEQLPKPTLLGLTVQNPRFFGIENPNKAQITAFQLAVTVFGKDAVDGFNSRGLTLLTVDGHRLGLQITVDAMGTGEGSFDVYPGSKDGFNAAASAASSVLTYLNEHRYEDRLYLHFPKFLQFMSSGFKATKLEDLPPGLDELDEDKLVANSSRLC